MSAFVERSVPKSKEQLDHKSFLITIDGSMTAGKRVLAEKLADRYNLTLLNTGSTIRALALLAIEDNFVRTNETNITDIPADFSERIVHFYDNMPTKLQIEQPLAGSHTARIMVGEREMWGELLTYPKQKAVDNLSAMIAASPVIRQRLYDLWRDAVKSFDGAIVIGRKTGLDLFPQARMKLYLFASPEASAIYRVLHDPMAQKVVEDEKRYVRERDGRDKKNGLLERPPGALILDTSEYIVDSGGMTKLNERVAAYIDSKYTIR